MHAGAERCAPRRSPRSWTSTATARRRRRARAASGRDTVAKILFTSGSTGRAEGRDQHAADAVRQPGADPHRAGRSWRRAAGALRLAAVEPHLRRQPQLRPRALQRRHALHRRRQADAGGVRHDRRQPARDRDHRLLQRAAGLRAAAAGAARPTRRSAAHFFSRLQMLFYAAAGLRQEVADGFDGAGRRGMRRARSPG